MPQEMTWWEAIEKVLKDVSGCIHYVDILYI